MAEQKGPEQPKSLEMRVAELEDKLSKMHVTEEEIKAYHKVASLMGGQAAGVGPALSPQVCIISRCFVNPICIVRCIIRCIINPECFECGGCGPCLPTSGTGSAGGFGSLGT